MSNINERYTNWDEAEFAQQRREAAKRKKEILAKRAEKQGLPAPGPAKRIKKTEIQKQADANKKGSERVDNAYSIIEELRSHFSVSGKGVSKNETAHRMQQFLRYTDREFAIKNISGGAIFTDNNRSKNDDVWGRVYKLVDDIRCAAREVVYQLNKYRTPDARQLLDIKYKILALNDTLGGAKKILEQPVVKEAIKNRVPFWVGGEEGRGGHNVGMQTILSQFVDDYEYNAYIYIAERIEETIEHMNDPLSCVAESKKTTIKESQLRRLIRESIIRTLNKDTTDDGLMNRWDNLVEMLGPEEMCNALFKAMSHDQIESMVDFLERNYEVGDIFGSYDEEKYGTFDS